jgi:type IV secretory pathway VirJ component
MISYPFSKKIIVSLLFPFALSSKAQDRDMPLVVGQKDTSRFLVFHICGDGGWKRFDVKLGDEFSAQHMPYVCLNSIKYFWSAKTPDQLAKDMIPVIHEYLKKWNKTEIILTGFSFGAEVLPFLYTRLPADLKQKVKLVMLITPAGTSDFAVHVSDMLGFDRKYPYDVAKEVEKIKNVKVLGVFGDKENSTFPMGHKQENCKITFVKGSHHFTDAKAVMDLLVKELK